MKKRSKRYKSLFEKSKMKKISGLDSIISEIKSNPSVKFVESIDLSLKINLKKIKGADTSLRTAIELPNGNGKKIRVGIVCDDNKLSEAKKSGADVVGSDDLLKQISSGVIKFDKLICTSSMMPKIGKLGKILGPKGLMPNPKLGTVSDDLKTSVDKVKNKLVEIKNDKDGNLGISIGRKTFAAEKLKENVKSLFEILKKDKPNIFNSENVKKIYLSSTMGTSFKLNFKEI
tara:strand:- start:365 stop:1057 length:693 start_codon:yes stop_codon:yes gene_type:complete